MVVLLLSLSIIVGSYFGLTVTKEKGQVVVIEDNNKEVESAFVKQQKSSVDIQAKTSLKAKKDENIESVTTEVGNREVSLFVKQQESSVDIEKVETDLQIEQDEKAKAIVPEQNIEKALKPHHLYVKSPQELQQMRIKRIHQRDQAKRMKIIREKHNATRKL